MEKTLQEKLPEIPEMGPDEQVAEIISSPQKFFGALVGGTIGGVLTYSGFVLSHEEHPVVKLINAGQEWHASDFVCIHTIVSAACLAYSAEKVYKWSKSFLGKRPAFCAVIVLEAVMLLIENAFLKNATLGILVCVNVVTAGYMLASNKDRRMKALKAHSDYAEAEAIREAREAELEAQRQVEIAQRRSEAGKKAALTRARNAAKKKGKIISPDFNTAKNG